MTEHGLTSTTRPVSARRIRNATRAETVLTETSGQAVITVDNGVRWAEP